VEIKILGLSGSPVKKGNVEAFLAKMMGSVSAKPGVTVETVSLAELDIQDCRQCNFCWRKQTEKKYCAIDDDAQAVFEKVEQADILVLASPVYFHRTSARMAALIDRLRNFMFGNVTKGRLKNKIGVSAAVAFVRHGGLESTHWSHILAFLTLEMIPVSSHDSISMLGASAVSSPLGSGRFDSSVRIAVDHDEVGLLSTRPIMERAIELATIIKKGDRGNS